VRAVPRLCEFYPGICLTTEEKARKNLSQVKKNPSHSAVYILPKTPTHYNALTNTHITKPTHTHTLQNNIKPPQYKLKRNAYRKSKSTLFLMLLIHRYNTPILTGPSLHFPALQLTSLRFTNHEYPSRYTPIWPPSLHYTTLYFTALQLTSLHFTNHKYSSRYTPI